MIALNILASLGTIIFILWVVAIIAGKANGFFTRLFYRLGLTNLTQKEYMLLVKFYDGEEVSPDEVKKVLSILYGENDDY